MKITDPLTKQIHIKMSGCPNGCSQHHIATIGFYGASIKVGEHTIPAYIPHIGGNYEGGEVVFGQRLKARLPAKRVPDAVERWIRHYEENRERRRELQRLRRPGRLRRVRGADLGPEAAGRVQRREPPPLHRLEPLASPTRSSAARASARSDGADRPTHAGPPGTRRRNGNGRKGILHEASATEHAAVPAAELDGLGFDPEAVAAELEDASAEEALALGARHFHPRMYIACSFQKTSSVTVHMATQHQPGRALLLPRHRRPLPRDLRDPRPRSRSATGSTSTATARSPSSSRRSSTATSSGAATPTPAAGSARSSRCARRSPPSTAGSRASAATDSQTRAEAPKFGWDKRFGLWKLNPLADWSEERGLGLHPRARHPLQPAPRSGLSRRSAAPTAPGSRRAGEDARAGPLGRHSTRPSAACTAEADASDSLRFPRFLTEPIDLSPVRRGAL